MFSHYDIMLDITVKVKVSAYMMSMAYYTRNGSLCSVNKCRLHETALKRDDQLFFKESTCTGPNERRMAYGVVPEIERRKSA